MSLWLVLIITMAWFAICAFAVSLCMMAARGDRVDAARLKLVPADRHTERRPLRLHRKSPARSNAAR